MPFGCFGKRKKKSPDAAPEANGGADAAATAVPGDSATSGDVAASEEVVTSAKASGLQSSVPEPALRSASLARSDFLRKSDYENSADRWEALKRQYLMPKMSQSQHAGHHLAVGDGGSSAPREAKSLPREFSPPSTVVSVVKFSQWFYDRQLREEEARKEAQEREEKAALLMQTNSEVEKAEAAATIQAGFRGFATRKSIHEQQQRKDAAKSLVDGNETDQDPQQGPRQEETQQQQKQEQERHDHSHIELDDLDPNDPRLNEAASKIQAGFKGMHARKEVQQMRRHIEEEQHRHQADEQKPQADEQKPQADEQKCPIEEEKHHIEEQPSQPSESHPDHTEAELNEAASKIQAGFKGYKTRKEISLVHHGDAEAEAAATPSS